ncbi:GAF domain-containing sensor histidine kinase [Nocardioides iriomotensis]|uniref:GAF domain-containing protein n=1 Tax=Nocardioides iriomotensis TaxID=715784 RepID=A0A4Q5J2D5_9ACTN|nr:GAF domain-containing sensor histidine kinase [Nocardioides iriomotensis]RYU12717.1 GAF domain-containing protein [Nocardioides iriomotensis]
MTQLDLPDNARALLDAVVAISSDIELHTVLDRIVVAACKITGAQYGALGVVGNDRTLVDFVTHGLDDELREKIGDLPRGHGILGLLIDHPEPIRLEHLQQHPRSYGFPANHPPMESFLGVPVRIRGTVFGNLYLTEKDGGQPFTETDEMLVDALATAAGFVIDNARAYARSERRRMWLEASARVTEALQPPVHVDAALRDVAVAACRVAEAVAVAVVQSRDGERTVTAVEGPGTDQVPHVLVALDGTLARCEEQGERLVVPAPEGSSGTVLLVPLRAHLAAAGVLLVLLASDRGALEGEEIELLTSFADQAGLALDRAQAVSDREELLLVADRDRIARDLHDLVIQRLFATGLGLQGASRIAGDEVKARLASAVDDLDVTIRDIRSTIFELQHAHSGSLRADLRGVVKEYVPTLGFTPLVRTTGPLDSAVTRELADQVLAVLREALSNVARHARADAAVVEVEATAQELMLTVTDNGTGLPERRDESGLRNVRRRASEHGGAARLLPEEPHGTRLEWVVPLG